MACIPIADLSPHLREPASKQFKAVVTLIWPWSSSARQFALLLAEPSLRLRRRKGQVRVRFTGSSARAIATTSVGIGDDVTLSLRGAEFVQDGGISTPGKCVDWELEYSQTLAVHIFRNGNEIANLDLLDVAPTPAALSPARKPPPAIPSTIAEYSSPAFLKRARLSDGPVLDAGFGSLWEEAEEVEEGRDRKRPRKSFGDWKTWTYSARTPSPEKEEEGTEDLDGIDVSPTRKPQLPVTPISSRDPDIVSVAGLPVDPTEEDALMAEHETPIKEDFVRDADYYDLYAGPDELPPPNMLYTYEGDTEPNTEDDDRFEHNTINLSTTESNTEGSLETPSEHQLSGPAKTPLDTTSEQAIDEDQDIVVDPPQDDGLVADYGPLIAMPPPTLPFLQTDFPAASTPGLLTPIGKEPSSPTLKPLDSSTLPMPSPFPGENDINISSYLDHVEPEKQEPQADISVFLDDDATSETSYMIESSFYSSVSASNAPAFGPTHESAFTDLRFTFGMDGSVFSRQTASKDDELEDVIMGEAAQDDDSRTGAVEDPFGNPFAIPNEFISQDQPASKEHHEENAVSERESPAPQQLSPHHEIRQEVTVPDVDVDSIRQETRSYSEGSHSSTEEPAILQEVAEADVIVLTSGSNIESDDETSVFIEGDTEADTEGDTSVLEGNEGNVMEDVVHEAEEAVREPHLELPAQESYQDLAQDQDANARDRLATPPTNMQQYTETNDVVDLGSGSEEDGNESEHAVIPDPVSPNDRDISTFDSNSESKIMEQRQSQISPPHVTSDELSTYKNLAQIEHKPEIYEDEEPVALDNREETMPVVATDHVDHPMSDATLAQRTTHEVESHSDIKMESIEEDIALSSDEQRNSPVQENEQTVAGPSAEVLIAVPEGHKLGELQYKSVLATGPARNTRSKTKASMSPALDESPKTQRTTRSKKSKAWAGSAIRTTTSPFNSRSRSTVTPTTEAMPKSPYSLRSQSKLVSPTKSVTSIATPERQTRLKFASKQNPDSPSSPLKDSFSDVEMTQSEYLDLPNLSFGPSQQPGTQGRFADVPYVKDSEEGSLHSEHSLSTIQVSDDRGGLGMQAYANSSDPMVPGAVPTKPPPTSSTPRRSSRLRKDVYEIPLDSEDEKSETGTNVESTPKASTGGKRERWQGEDELLPISPRIADRLDPKDPSASAAGNSVGIEVRSSPPATTHSELASYQQSLVNSALPMTPEPTQQTFVESQAMGVTGELEQTLPMTPQLTQATSTDVQSFKADVEMDELSHEPLVKPSPTTKTTPRHSPRTARTAVKSAQPTAHHEDLSASDDDATLVNTEPPSIGLSTPIAYYTPLKDVRFFLNRSSQFHSSSNPDVLALVTSSTTPHKRAEKGLRHWNTTLHVTDLSLYPATTTVQIFRPYNSALPTADKGDVVLLRSFQVKSLNRQPSLISGEDSSWCVWRWGKPVWGIKRVDFGEIRAREEIKGPAVERGEGEWKEAEKLRAWWTTSVRADMEEKQDVGAKTRSRDKGKETADGASGADTFDG